MRRWMLGLVVLARAVAFFALWELLVDATDEPDLLTGAACAVAAAVLATAVQGVRSVRARPQASMLRLLHRPFLLLVVDSLRVTAALFAHLVLRRPVTGSFRATRYRATGDGQEDAARRLLTIWGASLAPNRYAVGIDRDARVLVVHELVRASGPLDPLALG